MKKPTTHAIFSCVAAGATAMVLLAAAPVASAQERIYRCGNEYTNNAARAQQGNCQLLKGGHVTVVHAPPQAAVPKRAQPSPSAASSPGSAQVAPAQQKARDNEARAILQAELDKAQAKLATLKLEYNEGNPHKSALELRNPQVFQERLQALQAQIARQEADVQSIQRELARHKGG